MRFDHTLLLSQRSADPVELQIMGDVFTRGVVADAAVGHQHPDRGQGDGEPDGPLPDLGQQGHIVLVWSEDILVADGQEGHEVGSAQAEVSMVDDPAPTPPIVTASGSATMHTCAFHTCTALRVKR
ncbi:hypothetical protein [Streptomyces shenzhenensis]|uniref:hypothetical protein n=1 Tax=Streptomyces shenzhenensis TaxID=943815 RepID=UPI0036BBA6BC